MLYVGILIIAPLARLVIGAFAEGVSPILAALAQPDVLAAFRLTLLISLLTVVFHAIFGMARWWAICSCCSSGAMVCWRHC
jgi:sulfate transport system permease protein